jgi:hypothetical protein
VNVSFVRQLVASDRFLPLGHALLPEVLQGLLWLLNSRQNLTPLSIIAPFPADATQESPRSTYRLPRRDRPISFPFAAMRLAYVTPNATLAPFLFIAWSP